MLSITTETLYLLIIDRTAFFQDVWKPLRPFGENRMITAWGNSAEGIGGRVLIIRDFAEGQGRYGAWEPQGQPSGSRLKDIKSTVAIPSGLLISDGGDSALTDATTDAGIYRLAYADFLDALNNETGNSRPRYESVSFNSGDFSDTLTRYDLLARVGNRIYVSKSTTIYAYDLDLNIVSDELIHIFNSTSFTVNILGEARRDMTAFRNYLYYLTTHRLFRVDIHKARRPQSKQTIYPQFVAEGGALDLTQFVEGADEIVWGTGFSKPSYLSIDANFQLQVALNAVTEDTTLLVKLSGINDVGATLAGTFEFYLTILQAKAPVWQVVTSLSMFTDNTLNLLHWLTMLTVSHGAQGSHRHRSSHSPMVT